MLVLARKLDQRIMIGDDVEISVVEIKGDTVKLGIVAPRSVKVYRYEVYEAIQQENIKAAKTPTVDLPSLESLLSPERPKKDEDPSESQDRP